MTNDDDYTAMLESMPTRKKRVAGKRDAGDLAVPLKETALQRQIMEAIRLQGLWVIRIPGQGTIQHVGKGRAILKPSTLAGFPDLLILGPEGMSAWLEVKTAKGRASALQQGRIARLATLGHIAAIVRSPQQALDVLRLNGFLEDHAAMERAIVDHRAALRNEA